MLSIPAPAVARLVTARLGTGRIRGDPLSCAGSKQPDDLIWDPARLTQAVGKHPLGSCPRHDYVIGRDARPRHRMSRDRNIGDLGELAKHQILPIDARSTW